MMAILTPLTQYALYFLRTDYKQIPPLPRGYHYVWSYQVKIRQDQYPHEYRYDAEE